jgi:hypothetical protein
MTVRMDIEYRRAIVEDTASLATYISPADDGLYDYLLDDLIPTFTIEEILLKQQRWRFAIRSLRRYGIDAVFFEKSDGVEH